MISCVTYQIYARMCRIHIVGATAWMWTERKCEMNWRLVKYIEHVCMCLYNIRYTTHIHMRAVNESSLHILKDTDERFHPSWWNSYVRIHACRCACKFMLKPLLVSFWFVCMSTELKFYSNDFLLFGVRVTWRTYYYTWVFFCAYYWWCWKT